MQLLFFHTWIDYFDGTLARARGANSLIGEPLV